MDTLQLWRDDSPTPDQIKALNKLRESVNQFISVRTKGQYSDEIVRLTTILRNRRFKARMNRLQIKND